MATTSATLLDDILTVLNVVERRPNGHIICWCPFHADGAGTAPHQPDLLIKPGNRGAAYIWGCPVCSIGGTLLQLAERLREIGMMPRRDGQKSGGRIIDTYDYRDQEDQLLYQVVRRPGKVFRHRVPDGNGGWNEGEGCMKGVRRVPYRLPELLAASADVWAFIVEGEDADSLAALPLVATTNSGGALKWRAEFGQYFRDRWVAILPDNDDAGRAHAQDVASKVAGHAKGVCIVELPDLPAGNDVTDWLGQGHTLEELGALVEKAPAYSRQDGEKPNGGQPELSFRTASQIRTNPLSMPPTLIEGILFSGEVAILTGPWDALKSKLAAEIACAIVSGEPLLGRFEVKLPGPVLWVQEEIHGGVFDNTRVLPLVADWPEEVADRLMVVSRQGFRLEGDWITALEATIIKHQPRLIIIDPLTEVLPTWNGFNLNLDTHVTSMLCPVKALRDTHSMTFLIVHHDPKQAEYERHARGSSVLMNAPDVRFTLQGIQSADGIHRSKVTIRSRNMIPPLPFNIACMPDGRLIWEDTLNVGSVERESAMRVVIDLTDRLGRRPTTKEVAQSLGVSLDATRARLYRAQLEGYAKSTPAGREKVWEAIVREDAP